MKTSNILLTVLAILGLAMLTSPALQAQTCDGTGSHYVDLNGDGFNDNAPDADGDGIPNGLDPDWIKNAQDGDGYQHQKGKAKADMGLSASQSKTMSKSGTMSQTMTKSQQFYRLQAFNGNLFQYRYGSFGIANGPGDGICDGTGGNGSGTGVCDGTGPNGNQRKGGK